MTAPTTPASTPARPGLKFHRVALLGNPNTGKSTIFNWLTGLRQRVANYPGITVDAHRGKMRTGQIAWEVIDLPGCYSLNATSPEEKVVVDLLQGKGAVPRPDVLVCIVDATNLKRNLFLALQLAELGLPMILVLNQWDLARKRGLTIQLDALERTLGVPVIATVGSRGEGIDALREAIEQSLENPRMLRPVEWDAPVQEAIHHLRSKFKEIGVELDLFEARRMLFDGLHAAPRGFSSKNPEASSIIEESRAMLRAAGLNPSSAEAVLSHQFLSRILTGLVEQGEGAVSATDHSIDAVLVHRVWGSLIFVSIMALIFQFVYAWAAPLMEVIESATTWAQEEVGRTLEGTPLLQSLLADGVLAGVGSVVVFLPQIFVLFFFIAILEDCGYLARAAFLIDKLFGWCGLNGKSFVPLLSSYACAIPGILATRALEDPSARRSTILMAPFMSCSARLPVYVLLIGTFIEPHYGPWAAGWALFGMHFVGLAVALPLVWAANRFIFKTRHLPFILEFTGYRIPAWRNVVFTMWEGGREFLVRAGTVILAFSIVIWALLYFPRSQQVETETIQTLLEEQALISGEPVDDVTSWLEENPDFAAKLEQQLAGAWLEDSYLGRFARAVQPVFSPAGFDWKITAAILASFPAREVIISTLGIIYRLGPEVDEESDTLRERMANDLYTSGPRVGEPVFSLPVAVALMIFFALCLQCGSTVAVMARQLSWTWAVGAFVFMTSLAWLAAVLVYQVSSRLWLG